MAEIRFKGRSIRVPGSYIAEENMPNIVPFHHKTIEVEIRIIDTQDPNLPEINPSIEMWKRHLELNTPLTIELHDAWIQTIDQELFRERKGNIPGVHTTVAKLMVKDMQIKNE